MSKGIFVLAIGLLAGIYLPGYLTLLLLRLDIPLQWSTYWTYFNSLNLPQVAPYARKIKLGGAIGFGAPLLGYAFLLVLILRPKPGSLHGDARFARSGDLAQKHMFKPTSTGIVVGKFGGKLVRLSGQQFVILATPHSLSERREYRDPQPNRLTGVDGGAGYQKIDMPTPVVGAKNKVLPRQVFPATTDIKTSLVGFFSSGTKNERY